MVCYDAPMAKKAPAKKSSAKKAPVKKAKKAGVKPTGKLTTKRRNALKPSKFGLPPTKDEAGKYPMPDKSHASNAKARASQQLKKGNLSKTEYDKIVRKADKILYGVAKKK